MNIGIYGNVQEMSKKNNGRTGERRDQGGSDMYFILSMREKRDHSVRRFLGFVTSDKSIFLPFACILLPT
jgi:hypothetical protein